MKQKRQQRKDALSQDDSSKPKPRISQPQVKGETPKPKLKKKTA